MEQKKQFDRALEVYVQILDEGGKDLDDEDVPLFNRVGDMLMRKGSVTEALGYYERAVDVYAERVRRQGVNIRPRPKRVLPHVGP